MDTKDARHLEYRIRDLYRFGAREEIQVKVDAMIFQIAACSTMDEVRDVLHMCGYERDGRPDQRTDD